MPGHCFLSLPGVLAGCDAQRRFLPLLQPAAARPAACFPPSPAANNARPRLQKRHCSPAAHITPMRWQCSKRSARSAMALTQAFQIGDNGPCISLCNTAAMQRPVLGQRHGGGICQLTSVVEPVTTDAACVFRLEHRLLIIGGEGNRRDKARLRRFGNLHRGAAAALAHEHEHRFRPAAVSGSAAWGCARNASSKRAQAAKRSNMGSRIAATSAGMAERNGEECRLTQNTCASTAARRPGNECRSDLPTGRSLPNTR